MMLQCLTSQRLDFLSEGITASFATIAVVVGGAAAPEFCGGASNCGVVCRWGCAATDEDGGGSGVGGGGGGGSNKNGGIIMG